ncbi:hypothetical protein [Helicobacter sp. 16-1353]|nr:hypothetical protein [Helicobacter sp. 16-1353]
MNIFHRVIVAYFICFILAGCGYKADPFYSNDSTESQETTSKTIEER